MRKTSPWQRKPRKAVSDNTAIEVTTTATASIKYQTNL